MGGIFPYFLYKKNIICILIWEFNLFFYFLMLGFEAQQRRLFVVNAIRLVLEHFQLFTYHHAAKVVKVVANYRTNMGIPSSSSSSDE